MLLVIDNYDSFVQNIARYLVELGQEVRVVRNDALTVSEIREMRPAAIVISPGPCTPLEAGISLDVIRELAGEIPILGICLGHQAIGAAFGGSVVRAGRPMHGEAAEITHRGHPLFAGLPQTFLAARYHSLVVEHNSLPAELEPLAWTTDGPEETPVLMALRHREHSIIGLQFHPESILTQGGHRLLANFLTLAGIPVVVPAIDLQSPSFAHETGRSIAGPAAVFW
jgi:anthranilate synthase/aminodeoxychorismate synthase-like glutamine amidotransferase